MLLEVLKEKEFFKLLDRDAKSLCRTASADPVRACNIGAYGINRKPQWKLIQDAPGGREQARGQAERKQVGEPEAPVDRVNRKIGDLLRTIGYKHHPDTDISGFIDAEVDH